MTELISLEGLESTEQNTEETPVVEQTPEQVTEQNDVVQLTDLEQKVANALRLSPNAAQLLLSEIQFNIESARAELIRSGVPSSKVGEDDSLVQQAIITYCLMNMNDEDKYEMYFNAFTYQQDNLRKTIPEDDEE